MTTIRFPVQPRLVPIDKAARRLHLEADQFRAALPALLREGFPAPCPITGHFDLVAIDAWFDRRAGLAARDAAAADAAALMRDRLRAAFDG